MPYLIEISQSPPQMMEVPHPTGCRTIMAPDHPKTSSSGTRSTVATQGTGVRGWLEDPPTPKPYPPPSGSSHHSAATSPQTRLPPSPQTRLPRFPQTRLPRPHVTYMMPSTRRSKAPSLSCRNLFSVQRGPLSSSSVPADSSASPTSPASPSACRAKQQRLDEEVDTPSNLVNPS